jgi:hypothetical protein
MTDDEIQFLRVAKGILRGFIQKTPQLAASSKDALRRFDQCMAVAGALDRIDEALTMERSEASA